MSRYQLFGRCMESDLPFPELATATGAADWVLRTVAGRAEPPDGSVYLGEDDVQGDIRVRLYRTTAGFWLAFDDSGAFELTADGRTIRWHRPTATHDDFEIDSAARIDVQGRVLALALHAEGRLCLHGSGVCTDGGGLGFLAPKFHGKSTLALALVSAGARLITDDTLVVDPAPIPLALPGVHAMRLWSDSARRLLDGRPDNATSSMLDRFMAHPLMADPAVVASSVVDQLMEDPTVEAPTVEGALYPTMDPTSRPIMDTVADANIGAVYADRDKLCLRDLPARRRMQEPAPLAALYLLAPVAATSSERRPAVERTRLSPTAAALALVGHGKLTPLLGQMQAALALKRAIDIARAVPVYTLSYVRDFDRLHEVVEQILDWHAGPVTEQTTAPSREVASPSVAIPYLVGR